MQLQTRPDVLLQLPYKVDRDVYLQKSMQISVLASAQDQALQNIYITHVLVYTLRKPLGRRSMFCLIPFIRKEQKVMAYTTFP